MNLSSILSQISQSLWAKQRMVPRIFKSLFSFLILFNQASALELSSLAVQYREGHVWVLDQQKLPLEEIWIDVETPEQMVDVIVALKVRGAPLIGIAAILSIAKLCEEQASFEKIKQSALLLREARPTAVNLAIYIDRLLSEMSNNATHEDLLTSIREIFNEDIALCKAMGENGASLIAEGERILTICNTGSLATAGIGTALGVIKMAHEQGKKIHVYACETRPLLQGGRLTAWELEQNNIPYTLICDSMAASLMSKGMIDRVLVGADRIAMNGDFANKIGTYSLAALASFHKVPFHVVAPYTTIDSKCLNGSFIKIEERAADEVRGVFGSFGKIRWSPANAPVYNPAFDVTPAELVTCYILDKGNLAADQISAIFIDTCN